MPKKTAAVSGVGGSSIATRSPRSHPWAASTLANRLAEVLELAPASPAHVAVEVLVDHRELVARVRSQTSAAML